ncbi:MAG: hypothetical protein GWP91_11730, partial [Rhodobacterales bacterium]|nr:hypothetical protein [Rhodobacterales bacterium]
DSDGDMVPDLCDLCEGFDDLDPTVDADADTVPDACDLCEGVDDHDPNYDRDLDGIPDDCDICPDGGEPVDVDDPFSDCIDGNRGAAELSGESGTSACAGLGTCASAPLGSSALPVLLVLGALVRRRRDHL